MTKLKVYRPALAWVVSGRVIDALWEPRHVRQAVVLVAAGSKKEAIRLLADLQGLTSAPSLSAPDFRVASGNDLDALLAAGLLATPSVIALPLSGGEARVVELTPDGIIHLGRLVPSGRAFVAASAPGLVPEQ